MDVMIPPDMVTEDGIPEDEADASSCDGVASEDDDEVDDNDGSALGAEDDSASPLTMNNGNNDSSNLHRIINNLINDDR